jgi:hypothetical protein
LRSERHFPRAVLQRSISQIGRHNARRDSRLRRLPDTNLQMRDFLSHALNGRFMHNSKAAMRHLGTFQTTVTCGLIKRLRHAPLLQFPT